MLDVRDLRRLERTIQVLDAVWVLESIPGGMSRCPLRQEVVGVTLDSTLLITSLDGNTRLIHCLVCFIYDGLSVVRAHSSGGACAGEGVGAAAPPGKGPLPLTALFPQPLTRLAIITFLFRPQFEPSHSVFLPEVSTNGDVLAFERHFTRRVSFEA